MLLNILIYHLSHSQKLHEILDLCLVTQSYSPWPVAQMHDIDGPEAHTQIIIGQPPPLMWVKFEIVYVLGTLDSHI